MKPTSVTDDSFRATGHHVTLLTGNASSLRRTEHARLRSVIGAADEWRDNLGDDKQLQKNASTQCRRIMRLST